MNSARMTQHATPPTPPPQEFFSGQFNSLPAQRQNLPRKLHGAPRKFAILLGIGIAVHQVAQAGGVDGPAVHPLQRTMELLAFLLSSLISSGVTVAILYFVFGRDNNTSPRSTRSTRSPLQRSERT